MKFELDDAIYEKIKALSASGDSAQREKKYAEAIGAYKEAMSLVPSPEESWEASTWLLVAMGETYFFMKEYEEAEKCLLRALNCPGGEENPFIHFRLGQAYFELAKMEEAERELSIAYRSDGQAALFQGEDKKYYDLARKGEN
jgi:tetratricopeptide (TPR) repeat protein